jgi:hypothetical protein
MPPAPPAAILRATRPCQAEEGGRGSDRDLHCAGATGNATTCTWGGGDSNGDWGFSCATGAAGTGIDAASREGGGGGSYRDRSTGGICTAGSDVAVCKWGGWDGDWELHCSHSAKVMSLAASGASGAATTGVAPVPAPAVMSPAARKAAVAVTGSQGPGKLQCYLFRLL